MDRIYGSSVSGSPPAYPSSPANGYPQSGNPLTATPATKPTPWWFHMITEEMRNAIVTLGGTPAGATVNQLATQLAAQFALKAALASPVFTGDPQGPTAPLGDNDTSLATTAFVQANQHACNCIFLYSSLTSLVLRRRHGSRIIINGIPRTLPTGDVSKSNSGLSANTTYYAYAYWTGSAIDLEYSTTGYTLDVNGTGVMVKNGDTSRTLVGMFRTDASTQFNDAASKRLVRTWFNDPGITVTSMMPGSPNSAAVSANAWTEITSTARAEFLTWAGESISGMLFSGNVNIATAGNTINLGLGIDSTTVATAYAGCRITPANTSSQNMAAVVKHDTLSEGYHYCTPLAASNGTINATFQHSLTPADGSVTGTGAIFTTKRNT